jgi:hypothetical protein
VINKLTQMASDLDILECLDDGFAKREKPIAPNPATADATRKFDNERAEYKREADAIFKLREAAERYLSVEAYEHLCVRLGRSAAACLSAKEIFDGINEHYAKLTDAQAEDKMNLLQRPWDSSPRLPSTCWRLPLMSRS